MSFELNTLAFHDTFALHLVHPVTQDKLYVKAKDGQDDETKPVTISLYGTASKQYRNAVTAMQNRQLRRQAKKDKPSAEVIREESVSLLVACAATSTNLAHNGKPVIDSEGFRALFSDPTLSWVKDQVDEALGDTANFLAQ